MTKDQAILELINKLCDYKRYYILATTRQSRLCESGKKVVKEFREELLDKYGVDE